MSTSSRYTPELEKFLREFWQTYTDAEFGRQSDQVPVSDGEFRQKAWDSFDFEFVAGVLLDERSAFYGLKEVLFQGFCYWALAPNDSSLRKSALSIEAARILTMHERLILEDLQHVGIFADFVVRLRHIGPRFLREIYYGVGGLSTFAMAPPRAGFHKRVTRDLAGIEEATALMETFHHVLVSSKTSPALASPSLERSVDVFEHLGLFGTRSMKAKWAKHKDNIEFIYAAKHLMVEEESLLSALSNNWVMLNPSTLREWFGRARYVSEFILDALPVRLGYERERRNWLNVAPIEFDPPQLSSNVISSIEQRYIRMTKQR